MAVEDIVSRIPNVRNTSTAFESLNTTARDFTAASNNPASVINARVQGQIRSLQYPLDLGKYQFIIIEGDFVDVNYIRFEKIYRLPLPSPIQEHHQTHFDKDFNFLSILGSLAENIPGSTSGAVAGGVDIAVQAARGFGLSVNQFKTVTLRSPEFNSHNLNWKFSPKNKRESDIVRDITYGLKTGMAPSLQYGRTVFTFPKVYIMYFVPNMQYLFKFKPCVLQEIIIDYQGGNPAPAFYNSTGSTNSQADFAINSPVRFEQQSVDVTVSQSPPESVVMRTRWLELEYWVQEDFTRGGGATSTNPFSVFNWYNNSNQF